MALSKFTVDRNDHRTTLIPLLNPLEYPPALSFDFRAQGLHPSLTFSRNSTATYMRWNGTSLLVTSAAANEPRFDWATDINLSTAGSAPGLLIEPQKTNRLCHSETFATSGGTNNWTRTNLSVVSSNNPSPAGTNNAIRFRATSTNGALLCSAGGTAAPAGGRTFSVWIRRVVGTGAIQLSANNAGFTAQGGVDGTWKRFSISPSGGTTNIPVIRITTQNDEIEVWGAQLEEAYSPTGSPINSATSYIPTTTSVQTRLADDVIVDGNPFTQAYNPNSGTFAVQFQRRAGGITGLFSVNSGSLDNEILFIVANTGGTYSITEETGGYAAISPINFGGGTTYAIRSCAVNYSVDAAQAVQAGTIPPSILTGGSVFPSGIYQMYIGSEAEARYLTGVIYQFKYWPIALQQQRFIDASEF